MRRHSRLQTSSTFVFLVWLWSTLLTSSTVYAQPLPTPDQLDQLLAPIALFPDALVAQICAASTDPQQILEANAWVQQNLTLTGQARTDAAQAQGFDSALISLVNFAQVPAPYRLSRPHPDLDLRAADRGHRAPEIVLQAVGDPSNDRRPAPARDQGEDRNVHRIPTRDIRGAQAAAARRGDVRALATRLGDARAAVATRRAGAQALSEGATTPPLPARPATGAGPASPPSKDSREAGAGEYEHG
jgi:hypothetical protein